VLVFSFYHVIKKTSGAKKTHLAKKEPKEKELLSKVPKLEAFKFMPLKEVQLHQRHHHRNRLKIKFQFEFSLKIESTL